MTGRRKSVAVVTDRRFWRRSIGSEQRVANLLDHLAERGYELTIAYPGRLSSAERRELASATGPHPSFELVSRPLVSDAWSALLRLMPARGRRGRSANPLLDRKPDARTRFVHGLLRTRRPAIVIVVLTRLTALVHPRPSTRDWTPHLLVDTLDVVHQRAASFRAQGAVVDQELESDHEAEALATYDAIIAIHDGDRRALAALVPGRPVLCVPHGIELPDEGALGLMDRDEDAAPLDRPLRLGLLGGRDASNLAGLSWFLDHVWPALQARFGDALELWVAGQICSRVERIEKGMRSLGPVATIANFWPQIDIAINPVRFGSGLKIKNVEALAWARPLVTSPVGAEGLEQAAPHALCVADSGEEWIDRISSWVTEPAARTAVARAGRRFAESRFAPRAAFVELDEYLARILDSAPRTSPP